jgi:hypothetical protein
MITFLKNYAAVRPNLVQIAFFYSVWIEKLKFKLELDLVDS